jgi:hypothetical protein
MSKRKPHERIGMTELRFELHGKRVWVAGHAGMVGSALCRRLTDEACEIVTASRASLDLTRQADVETWFAATKPEAVFVAAAKVGGIPANDSQPAEFIHSDLAIQTNVIDAAYRAGVQKVLFLGSSCIYPEYAAQPMAEDALLTGAWNPPISGMRSQRLPALKCAKPIGANTLAVSLLRCRPTCMGHSIILTCFQATWCRPYWSRRTGQNWQQHRTYRCGGQGQPGASFCTLMSSPTRPCI